MSTRELRSAAAHPIYGNRPTVPGLEEPSRLLATPISRAGRRLVLVVGATSQNDVETLASFRNELLIAGPIGLVLASVSGYLLAGFALRQVESMRKRAAAISAETPRERLPVPATADEPQRLGETLNEMLDRLESARGSRASDVFSPRSYRGGNTRSVVAPTRPAAGDRVRIRSGRCAS